MAKTAANAQEYVRSITKKEWLRSAFVAGFNSERDEVAVATSIWNAYYPRFSENITESFEVFVRFAKMGRIYREQPSCNFVRVADIERLEYFGRMREKSL